jgi:4-diphosphocytidyl-2-C-methyl-D-erythritol kinase
LRRAAFAKINLALVVGPRRSNGKHEVLTVLQRIDLQDEITVEPASALVVDGFDDDTIVRGALEALARAAGVEPRWRVRIEKRIPVAAGLGGGSSDAAAALRLANETLDDPVPERDLDALAARMGADVPFFLHAGTSLATADGTVLERLDLPLDYHVLLVLPHEARKASTGSVFEAFEARGGPPGFADRADRLRRALNAVRSSRDLAELPPNDLASSPISADLVHAGAFRADVTGAGPAVCALFEDRDAALRARRAVEPRAWTTLARPVAG